MGKRSPGNKTWTIKANKRVNYYQRLGALYSIWYFDREALACRQILLKKLVYLQKTRADPDGEDVEEKPSSGEMVLVL